MGDEEIKEELSVSSNSEKQIIFQNKKSELLYEFIYVFLESYDFLVQFWSYEKKIKQILINQKQ